MKLTISNAEFPNYFDVMFGSSGHVLLHQEELTQVCAPELVSALAESKEIECVIISKKLLCKYDLAWFQLEVERREGCRSSYVE